MTARDGVSPAGSRASCPPQPASVPLPVGQVAGAVLSAGGRSGPERIVSLTREELRSLYAPRAGWRDELDHPAGGPGLQHAALDGLRPAQRLHHHVGRARADRLLVVPALLR